MIQPIHKWPLLYDSTDGAGVKRESQGELPVERCTYIGAGEKIFNAFELFI